MKILIIDDEKGIRDSLSATLKDEGYEALAVSNGYDALAMMKELDFDIIITDLVLPGMDGMEILSKVKRDYPDTIVVMITGHESVENAVEAMKSGADDYIPKPVLDPDEMLMKLAKAVEIRQIKNENRNFHRRLESELDIARKIQQALLPQQVPKLDQVDISVFSQSAKHVGGDYHDLIEISPNKIGIAIGDVSGKGMPASLLMANVCASIRIHSESEYSPKDIMFKINNAFCPICQFIEEHRFITLFYGILDSKNKILAYSNAGHNYPFLFRDGRIAYELSTEDGLPCGIFENSSYDENLIALKTGDVLLFYTDGITEAMNNDYDVYGEERLINTVLENIDKSSECIKECISKDLMHFIGNAAQYDDMTLIIVKIL